MSLNTYEYKVYDGEDRDLWGSIRTVADSPQRAVAICRNYLERAVENGEEDIDLASMKLERTNKT